MPTEMSTAARQRLLHDIAELQEKPYPNIRLHVHDGDITSACLVLTPENCKPLHLKVSIGADWPLGPPYITIQTKITHPNVMGEYICASILNTTEGYTPAYTLKGVAIQLLSFFSSDSLEQWYGGVKDLAQYRNRDRFRDYEYGMYDTSQNRYRCETCRFGYDNASPRALPIANLSAPLANLSIRSTGRMASHAPQASASDAEPTTAPISKLPDELLLAILDYLGYEELTMFARVWPRIGWIITGYDVIRTRELQCFVLKKSCREVQLGIGVNVVLNGRQGTIQSEFDLLSAQAFEGLGVRQSIHGLCFKVWLPLPISRKHWQRVEGNTPDALTAIAGEARIDAGLVLYGFMNDIVVRLNEDIKRGQLSSLSEGSALYRKSTLLHASEKAIESYFHLFHLLICLATSDAGAGMVHEANQMINSFMDGKRSKSDLPNLGYLPIALLISDVEVTPDLIRAIIKEAITRNVVWLLDKKGAGMAELAYLEKDEISEYRLKRTFEGSRTSYRLLMFSELFRRIARPNNAPPPADPEASAAPPKVRHAVKEGATCTSFKTVSQPPQPEPLASSSGKKTLTEIREELFHRHGGPPPGTAARIAAEVRRLKQIDDFPSFLQEMGVSPMPSRSEFTDFLRRTVVDSHARGYSKQAITQTQALALRKAMDKSLDQELASDAFQGGMPPNPRGLQSLLSSGRVTFFPGQPKGGAGGGAAGGGRGRGASGAGRGRGGYAAR